MNEYDVAKKKVLPYILERLGWPEYLVRGYGRVPVQIGGSTVWADFVCYIPKDQKPVPWLLIEVKQSGAPLEQEALPQAESYSLILNAPFFCVMDGDEFDFYMTGDSQGKSVMLKSPPIPSSEYLPRTRVEYISFPPEIDNLVEQFLVGLKNEDKFREDTKRHHEDTMQLHERVFQRIDSLSPQELKEVFAKHMMMKPPNKNLVFKQIDEDFAKFKEVLKLIRDFPDDPKDPVIKIKRLIDKTENLHIEGGGIFFITQLLAGAHPDEYVVLEENVSNALRHLGVTDILVQNDTANGYVYINEICKKLFNEKLKDRLKDYDFGLAAVHNFLWHYYVHYRTKNKWFPKGLQKPATAYNTV